MDGVQKIVDDSVKEVTKIIKNKKVVGAAVGATIGYVLSKQHKDRNALIGGLAGYMLASKSSQEEEDDEDHQ